MYKIAVIEDNCATNDKFKSFLLSIWQDCDVKQYLTVDTALEGLRTINFDLIVSDIDLGDGTDRYGGLKIIKALDSQRTPFLVVSGLPQPEIHRGIFAALDAWDYLQKPVTFTDFAKQVKRAIAFRNEQKEESLHGDLLTQGVPDLEIDLSSREMVKWKKKRVTLSMTQIRILQKMIENLNQQVKYEHFFLDIETGRNKENLRVHVATIREAFKAVDPTFNKIRTITMIGYSWREDE
ncbi:response regulator [Undibacterium sp. TS12]|uniref:response regulator n=1 Tax=Undibacterium sp. TS12 TaxID=2908202 RepID=UPI001F4D215C|nr:response regulator [Undibacterium sp. TS12]MCH8618141.1 response regulator [Undibacterium sp. TS12]